MGRLRRSGQGDAIDDRAWKQQEKAWRLKLGISADWKPFDALKLQIRGWHHVSCRERCLLNLVAAEKALEAEAIPRTKASMKAAMSHTILDLSQNPGRRPFSNKDGEHRVLTTSTVQVHMGKCRVITPREMMYQQGHSRRLIVPECMGQQSLRRLAGEGMALPCLATCLWAQSLLKSYP